MSLEELYFEGFCFGVGLGVVLPRSTNKTLRYYSVVDVGEVLESTKSIHTNCHCFPPNYYYYLYY